MLRISNGHTETEKVKFNVPTQKGRARQARRKRVNTTPGYLKPTTLATRRQKATSNRRQKTTAPKRRLIRKKPTRRVAKSLSRSKPAVTAAKPRKVATKPKPVTKKLKPAVLKKVTARLHGSKAGRTSSADNIGPPSMYGSYSSFATKTFSTKGTFTTCTRTTNVLGFAVGYCSNKAVKASTAPRRRCRAKKAPCSPRGFMSFAQKRAFRRSNK